MSSWINNLSEPIQRKFSQISCNPLLIQQLDTINELYGNKNLAMITMIYDAYFDGITTIEEYSTLMKFVDNLIFGVEVTIDDFNQI